MREQQKDGLNGRQWHTLRRSGSSVDEETHSLRPYENGCHAVREPSGDRQEDGRCRTNSQMGPPHWRQESQGAPGLKFYWAGKRAAETPRKLGNIQWRRALPATTRPAAGDEATGDLAIARPSLFGCGL